MGWYSCNKQPCIQWHVTTYPFPSLFVYVYTYRKDFRQAFGQVGVIRSLIPAATNVLSCTATATEEIYLDVTNVLLMEKPHEFAMPPERPNIMYSVLEEKSLDEISDTICLKLESVPSPLLFPKAIIFCRKYVSQMWNHHIIILCMLMQNRRLWLAMAEDSSKVTVNVVTYVHSIVDVTTVQIIYMPVVIFTKTICTQCHHDHKHYDIAQKDNV